MSSIKCSEFSPFSFGFLANHHKKDSAGNRHTRSNQSVILPIFSKKILVILSVLIDVWGAFLQYFVKQIKKKPCICKHFMLYFFRSADSFVFSGYKTSGNVIWQSKQIGRSTEYSKKSLPSFFRRFLWHFLCLRGAAYIYCRKTLWSPTCMPMSVTPSAGFSALCSFRALRSGMPPVRVALSEQYILSVLLFWDLSAV